MATLYSLVYLGVLKDIVFAVIIASTPLSSYLSTDGCRAGMERVGGSTAPCTPCGIGMFRAADTRTDTCEPCPNAQITTMEGATSEMACVDQPMEGGNFNPRKWTVNIHLKAK